jgi:hypothetical protein
MIIPSRTEPVIITEIDTTRIYIAYTSIVPQATMDDLFVFLTTPSPERTRFLAQQYRTVRTANALSIIELIS